LLRQLLLFLSGKIKRQFHDLISHPPVIGCEAKITRLCCNAVLLLCLAIPLNRLA